MMKDENKDSQKARSIVTGFIIAIIGFSSGFMFFGVVGIALIVFGFFPGVVNL